MNTKCKQYSLHIVYLCVIGYTEYAIQLIGMLVHELILLQSTIAHGMSGKSLYTGVLCVCLCMFIKREIERERETDKERTEQRAPSGGERVWAGSSGQLKCPRRVLRSRVAISSVLAVANACKRPIRARQRDRAGVECTIRELRWFESGLALAQRGRSGFERLSHSDAEPVRGVRPMPLDQEHPSQS